MDENEYKLAIAGINVQHLGLAEAIFSHWTGRSGFPVNFKVESVAQKIGNLHAIEVIKVEDILLSELRDKTYDSYRENTTRDISHNWEVWYYSKDEPSKFNFVDTDINRVNPHRDSVGKILGFLQSPLHVPPMVPVAIVEFVTYETAPVVKSDFTFYEINVYLL